MWSCTVFWAGFDPKGSLGQSRIGPYWKVCFVALTIFAIGFDFRGLLVAAAAPGFRGGMERA
jgi:hypothetical protein